MIFVTVGTQLPFDRLLKMVDDAVKNLNVEVLYQIGPSEFRPSTGVIKDYLTSEEYQLIISKSTLIISHAGMGTIITALENAIPAMIVPREYSLGEHRNDHQLATAQRFLNTNGIYVARTKEEVSELISKCLTSDRNRVVNFENESVKKLASELARYIV
ncbi:glycosyltransferase [Rheinheimera gaetbuli]